MQIYCDAGYFTCHRHNHALFTEPEAKPETAIDSVSNKPVILR